MTSKEALRELLEIMLYEVRRDDYNYAEEVSKVIEKELEELTKYKRAFEILRKHLNIELVYTDEGCEPTWFLDSNCGREIEQEEYELLEELMKGA